MQGRRGGKAEDKMEKKKHKIYFTEIPRHLSRTARMYVGVIYDTTAAAVRRILSCVRTRTTTAAARQTANDAHDGREEL